MDKGNSSLFKLQILVIACGSDKVPNIINILEQFNGNCTSIDPSQLEKTDLNNFAGIVISGAPILLTKENIPRTLKMFASLLASQTPMLGICFGHQILGLMDGATVFMGTEERALTPIRRREQDSALFEGLNEIVEMEQDHCEYISLPENFVLLADSINCAVEAMQHRTRPIFGVQFHPEVSGAAGVHLLKNFYHICKNQLR